MGFASRSEYAILAVYELSRVFSSGSPLSAQKIARKYRLSSNFLIQTLRQLREAGLVDTERGAQGGYKLLINPNDIARGYVAALFELPIASSSAKENAPQRKSVEDVASLSPREDGGNDMNVRKKLDAIWSQGESKRQEYFNGITFSMLLSMESIEENALSFTI